MTGRTGNAPIVDADLLAYADGRLGPERREEVERHIAAHPETAERIAAWRQQNETLKALYDHVAAEPVPPRLDPHGIAHRRTRPFAGQLRAAAAALVLLVAGAGAGWYGRSVLVQPKTITVSLVSEATTAHALYSGEVVHPVEVGANQRDHLVTWLSKRLDRTLVAPDLSAQGFTLMGGRLLPTNTGPAAQFMYQDKTGHRVTLYIVPANGKKDSPLWSATKDGLEAIYWWHKSIDCAVVGDQPSDTLKTVAKAAYAQLG